MLADSSFRSAACLQQPIAVPSCHSDWSKFSVSEIRRYSLAAVILLVGLRLAIGWQLLYEGLWKIDTLKSPRPWTSAGYLKNSEGPLREVFRSMAGDPDELGWLNYDVVASRWENWAARFKTHYGLDERQALSIDRLLYGASEKLGDNFVFGESLAALPEGVDKLNVSPSVAWYDAKTKKLYVSAEKFLEPSEKAKIESLVKGRSDQEAKEFVAAVDRLYERQKNGMGYLNQLKGAVKGNPELVGNAEWQRLGKLEQYQEQLALYETARAAAKTSFQWDHLDHTWGKLQALRSELTGPIKSMESEFMEKAEQQLSVAQMSLGPVPASWDLLRIVDMLTIAGLTILGIMLLLGLGTKIACVLAAFMLFNFYMAMPPWPGVPEAPGPEHSFIVNKNLIEVIALCGLAALPTGQWFGMDAVLSGLLARRRSAKVVTTKKGSGSPAIVPG